MYSIQARLMARATGSSGWSARRIVSSRYSEIAPDSNSDTPIVEPQHRHLVVRRDGAEPVGPVVGLDMEELEIDLLLAQHDRDALHPGAGS